MKIFIICSVRGMEASYRFKLEQYTNKLEEAGHIVHLPHRDTNQKANGFTISAENMQAIKNADEVHIFYNRHSQGTHFDMGVAFAMSKKIILLQEDLVQPGYANMLQTWETLSKNKTK